MAEGRGSDHLKSDYYLVLDLLATETETEEMGAGPASQVAKQNKSPMTMQPALFSPLPSPFFPPEGHFLGQSTLGPKDFPDSRGAFPFRVTGN